MSQSVMISETDNAGSQEVRDDALAFAAWLTSRPGILTVGSNEECGPMAEALAEWRRQYPAQGVAERSEATFTHDDVAALRLEARRRRNGPHATVWSSLADRIAALLPPRQEQE